MGNFGDFLGNYININAVSQDVLDGNVTALDIDTKNRILTIAVAFSRPVRRQALFDVQKTLRNSNLNLSKVSINPLFLSETFSVGYYQDLILKITQETKSLSGILKDSSAKLDGENLVVSLAHGGKNILLDKKFDKTLQNLKDML